MMQIESIQVDEAELDEIARYLYSNGYNSPGMSIQQKKEGITIGMTKYTLNGRILLAILKKGEKYKLNGGLFDQYPKNKLERSFSSTGEMLEYLKEHLLDFETEIIKNSEPSRRF